MNLRAYLDRISFVGEAHVDLATLNALHRVHQQTVPFENIDVQLGRTLGLDVDAAYDKIVTRRRGGWCYELNGLFGAALAEIGFDVQRLSGGVLRETHGDSSMGNHLCLRVRLDRDYLVDVGFGGTLAGPLPLTTGARDDAPFKITLADIGEGFWRLSEQLPNDEPFTFDFRTELADEALFSEKCRDLQTNPSSSFVQNLVVQRREGESQLAVRGRVFSIVRADRAEKTLLESPAQLVEVLRTRFALEVPEVASLWPAICARHKARFDPNP